MGVAPLYFGLCVLVSIAFGVHSYLAYKEIRKYSYQDRYGVSIGDQEVVSHVLKAGNGLPIIKVKCDVIFRFNPRDHDFGSECAAYRWEGGFPSLFGQPSLQNVIFRSFAFVTVIIVVLNITLFRHPLWSFLKEFRMSPCGCLLKAGRARLRHRRDHIGEESKRYDAQVCHEILKQRCQYASKFVRAASLVLMGALVVNQLTTLLIASPWEEGSLKGAGHAHDHDSNGRGEALIGSELVPLCFACTVFLCLSYIKPLPTPGALNCANVLLSCMWIWRYFTLPRRWYAHWSPMIWAARLIQGIALGNFRLTTGLHTVVTVSDCMAHRAHMFDPIGSSSSADQGYVVGQLFVVFLATAMTYSFEKLMSSQAKALVDTKRSNKSLDLVHRLLSAMCDCIVQLDADHCVSKHSPQLSHLLLRRSSPGLVGQRFETMLPEVDIERFNHHIAEELLKAGPPNQDVPDDSPARPLHIHMVDVNGSLFPVELFCSVVQDNDSGCTFMIGIRDDTDAGGWRADTNNAPAISSQKIDQNKWKKSFQIDELSCSQMSMNDTVSIVGQDVCESICIPKAAPAVWIDAETADFDIVCCNLNFGFLFFQQSLVRNAPFFQLWEADQETEDQLKAGIVTVTNGAAYDIFQDFDVEQVKLVSPGGHWMMEARCTVSCCRQVCRPSTHPQIDDEADCEFPLVRLVFTDAKMHWKHRSRKHSSRTSNKHRGTHAASLRIKNKKAIAL